VTLTAETDCSFVTWPRKKLYLLLRKDRYVARLFSSHLGYDISEKLYSLNEKLFAKFGLRFDIRLPSLYHVLGPTSSEGEPEDCEEPLPASGPAGGEPPPQPPPPPPPPLPAPRPRASRPDSDLLAASNLGNHLPAPCKGQAPLAPTQTPEL
ncbi:PREDICTED: popeye domain-containing protein 2-like, partial [Cariama cristata]|uniref:popeye domain-containing protein 2-like n=1 Tax=Cariama cristata TaxID=54380 RepID=UPI000520AE8A